MEETTISVKPVAPFDFELTAGYHTYFQSRYGTDSLAGGIYRRLLDLDGKLVLASVRSEGSVETPKLAVSLQGDRLAPGEVARAEQQVAWLLGAGQDLGPFYALARGDPVMSAIVDRFHGLHLPHTASVFEALVLAILGQQIATNVARIIRTLLIDTYGPRRTFGGETYYAFPRPETLGAAPLEELRALKLSQRKAEYVQGFESLHEVSDEDAIRRVLELRGVGRWTAQWMLIRALGRPDALPLGDLALHRVVSRVFFEGADLSDDRLEEFSRRWSPWRTYATVYLFTALRRGMA